MAQKVQTLLIDDLDGSEATGTVSFMLDGRNYEIDLNAKHGRALRRALRDYIEHARQTSGSKPARGSSRTKVDPTRVREWAKAHGIEVKDRGRVPAELIAKYKAASGK